MAESMLSYDRERVRSLARRTMETIEFLDGTRCDDPAAAGAMEVVRGITHCLSTTWMPTFARIGNDTSMTGWNGAAFGGSATRRSPSAGPSQYDDVPVDEFLVLLDPNADPARGMVDGPGDMPMALLDELARRWDDLDPRQQQEAILYLLEWGSLPIALVLLGERSPLSFLPGWLDDVEIDPEFAREVIHVVAETGAVPAQLQPLVDRVGEEYGDVLVAGLNGVNDPATRAGLGLIVPFMVDPVTAAAFVGWLNSDQRIGIEGTLILDTTGFSLVDSVIAGSSDGTSWFSAMDFYGDENADYEGGGFVVGPDGREYPIAIPTVTTEDGTFTADAWTPIGEPSVANLGGADDGWEIVGYASGVERVQAAPGPLQIVLGGVAASTGLVQPAPPNTGLPYVVMHPNGPPHLSGVPPTLPTSENTPDADGMPLLVADVAVMAMNMDNQTERAYQVVLEQNEDGRIRARVDAFSLWENTDGDIVINPQHLYVDADGRLMSQGISYGAPFADDSDHVISPVPDVHGFHFDGYDFNPFPIPDAVFPAASDD